MYNELSVENARLQLLHISTKRHSHIFNAPGDTSASAIYLPDGQTIRVDEPYKIVVDRYYLDPYKKNDAATVKNAMERITDAMTQVLLESGIAPTVAEAHTKLNQILTSTIPEFELQKM
jgi:hypothetical protein